MSTYFTPRESAALDREIERPEPEGDPRWPCAVCGVAWEDHDDEPHEYAAATADRREDE